MYVTQGLVRIGLTAPARRGSRKAPAARVWRNAPDKPQQLVRPPRAREASFGRHPRGPAKSLPQGGVRCQLLDAVCERAGITRRESGRIDARGQVWAAPPPDSPLRPVHTPFPLRSQGRRVPAPCWREPGRPAHESPAQDPRRSP